MCPSLHYYYYYYPSSSSSSPPPSSSSSPPSPSSFSPPPPPPSSPPLLLPPPFLPLLLLLSFRFRRPCHGLDASSGPLIQEIRITLRAIPRAICCFQSGSGTGLSPKISFPVSIIPPMPQFTLIFMVHVRRSSREAALNSK